MKKCIILLITLFSFISCKRTQEEIPPVVGDSSIGDVGIDDAITVLDANGVPQPQQRTTFSASYKPSNKTANSIIVDIRGIQPVYRNADAQLRYFAQLLYSVRGSKYIALPGGQKEYRTSPVEFLFNKDTISYDRVHNPTEIRLLASVTFNGENNKGLEEFITREEAGPNAPPGMAFLVEPIRIQIGIIYPNGTRVLLFGLPTQVTINVNKE
ncbi:MAG: hypothetical protein NZM38_02490 [Cytophagales bacterium]|nr:hypothetical protein [Cytophagales bacterium]MDW8383621.1 hypothetical protein [Flammeovirgaceae bacterium]